MSSNNQENMIRENTEMNIGAIREIPEDTESGSDTPQEREYSILEAAVRLMGGNPPVQRVSYFNESGQPIYTRYRDGFIETADQDGSFPAEGPSTSRVPARDRQGRNVRWEGFPEDFVMFPRNQSASEQQARRMEKKGYFKVGEELFWYHKGAKGKKAMDQNKDGIRVLMAKEGEIDEHIVESTGEPIAAIHYRHREGDTCCYLDDFKEIITNRAIRIIEDTKYLMDMIDVARKFDPDDTAFYLGLGISALPIFLNKGDPENRP